MRQSIKGNSINKRNWMLTLGILSLLLVGALIYFNMGGKFTNSQVAQNENRQTKIFRSSEVMKFSVEVPVEYTVTEYLGSVTVDAGEKGKILIGRSGTNFNDLSDYLEDLNTKNKVEIIDKQAILLNGYKAYKQKMINDDENSRITYFIYINNWVFSISTSSEDLYDELDQIAKSFKYTGD